MSKHSFQPTDTQGYSMSCTNCGRYASFDDRTNWNKALEEECKMSKADRYSKKFDIPKKTVRKEIKKQEQDKKKQGKGKR